MWKIYKDNGTNVPQTIIDEIESAVDRCEYITISDGGDMKSIDEVCDYILNDDVYLSAPLIRLINRNPDIVEKIIRDYHEYIESGLWEKDYE